MGIHSIPQLAEHLAFSRISTALLENQIAFKNLHSSVDFREGEANNCLRLATEQLKATAQFSLETMGKYAHSQEAENDILLKIISAPDVTLSEVIHEKGKEHGWRICLPDQSQVCAHTVVSQLSL